MNIVQAKLQHLEDLIPLFDGYRVFYKAPSDPDRARNFLKERITNNESTIFLAYIENKAVGFTQLYPIFSSVSTQRMLLLNDLYVDDTYRGKGVGKALIDAAKDLCKQHNYKGLSLETAKGNPAQHLYEREGFTQDAYLHYFWTNNSDK